MAPETRDTDLPVFGSDAWEEMWRAARPEALSDGDALPEPPSGTRPIPGSTQATKLTAPRVLYMLKVLHDTNNQRTAARLGGITVSCWNKWRNAGRRAAEAIERGEITRDDLEAEELRKLQFFRAVERVRGGFEYRAAVRMKEIGFAEDGDWRALEKLLHWTGATASPGASPGASGADTINIAIRIDGGPPEGVDHDPSDAIEVETDG